MSMEPPFASVLTKYSGADEVCPEREIIAKYKHLFVVEKMIMTDDKEQR